MNWISVKERLPDFYGDTEFIVMIKGADVPTVLSYLGNGEWVDEDSLLYYDVTHRMPLPEPPEEKQK